MSSNKLVRARVYKEHPVLSRTNTDSIIALHAEWLKKPEDLTVQQRVDSSAWHRRAIGGQYTACGRKIWGVGGAYEHGSIRHESYTEELCREGCFSQFELEMSDKLNEAERKKRSTEQ